MILVKLKQESNSVLSWNQCPFLTSIDEAVITDEVCFIIEMGPKMIASHHMLSDYSEFYLGC